MKSPTPEGQFPSSLDATSGVRATLPEWMTRLRAAITLIETLPVAQVRYHGGTMNKLPQMARSHGWRYAR